MSKMKVVTIGLGYIGLPTSALIAQNNIFVHGVDINQNVVDIINQGKIHIVEPSLDIAVEESVKKGGNTDVTTVEFPNLNHLFQTTTTGSPSEYAILEETFSPDTLKVLSEWIIEKTK